MIKKNKATPEEKIDQKVAKAEMPKRVGEGPIPMIPRVDGKENLRKELYVKLANRGKKK